MRLLDWLGDIGIRHVTVSTPFLLEVIKARRPQFTVKVGIYAQVDTPRRAKFWEDLGADAINLESFSINRDFSRLAAIRAGRSLRPATDRQPLLSAKLSTPELSPERLRP